MWRTPGLAKKPGDRYPSAMAFVDALAAAAVPAPRRGLLTPSLRGSRRRTLVAALAVLVAALVVGGTTLGRGTGSAVFGPVPSALPSLIATASTAGASAPAIVSATPTHPIPAKGAQLYQAKLDGKALDFRQVGSVGGALSVADGAATLTLSRADGSVYAPLNVAARRNYVGELDFAMTPGSQVALLWSVRGSANFQLQYFVRVFATDGAIDAILWDAATQKQGPLTPASVVPGIATGGTHTLAVVARDDRFAIYLDERQITQFTDDRLGDAWIPSISLSPTTTGGTGSVRITGARIYELP